MNTQAFASLHRFHNGSSFLDINEVSKKAVEAGVPITAAMFYALGFDPLMSLAMDKLYQNAGHNLRALSEQMKLDVETGKVSTDKFIEIYSDSFYEGMDLSASYLRGRINTKEFLIKTLSGSYHVFSDVYDVDIFSYDEKSDADRQSILALFEEMEMAGELPYALVSN